MDPPNKHGHTFLPMANCHQFILDQYKKVGQKPFESATPKTMLDKKVGDHEKGRHELKIKSRNIWGH